MKTIICDIDGTLALRGDRDPYDASTAMEDAVNEPIAELLTGLKFVAYARNWELVFVSGRFERDREITKKWIQEKLFVCEPKLFLRANDDKRKDSVVKREIYETKIKPHFPPVLFVLDDRNQCVAMWRSLGLTCLQAAEGSF